jgi:hypothetical protein
MLQLKAIARNLNVQPRSYLAYVLFATQHLHREDYFGDQALLRSPASNPKDPLQCDTSHNDRLCLGSPAARD